MDLDRLSYLSPKVTIRCSPIDGRGLFAAEDLNPGEIVCVKGGHVFTRAILNRVAPSLGPAEIQIANDLFFGPICADERGGGMFLAIILAIPISIRALAGEASRFRARLCL
jgi:hypothetical protein